MLGLRLGDKPQVIASTTPKPTKFIRELMKQPGTVITRGSTFDNAVNLSERAIEQMKNKYEGTTLGRQELYGELIDRVEGAFWDYSMLDNIKIKEPPMEALHGQQGKIVIAIDPTTTGKKTSDEAGIIAVGKTIEDGKEKYIVLEDVSGIYSPQQWAEKAIDLYDKWHANAIIVERNQGGDMVKMTLSQIRHDILIHDAWAKNSKAKRAEPVVALYQQGKVFHLHGLNALEDEMCTWDARSGSFSPNRIDALVWGVHWLRTNLYASNGQSWGAY